MAVRDDRYVELFQVGKSYPNPMGIPIPVVEEFDLIMRRGDVVSLIGHSGCGKSTVLSMVAGLHETSRGSIAIGGREISGPGPDRAVVFQAPCLMPWLTAYQNVRIGVDQAYPHASRSERDDVCIYYLTSVGLSNSMHRLPRELSGGMQQRVGIARAIALKPRLLLLDEPFGRLDSITRMELQDVILRILDRESITTLLVTHDVDEALYMSDRVCMMTCGPRARIGQLLEVPFVKPRQRAAVLEHPLYYDLRACLMTFLQQQSSQHDRLQDVEFVTGIEQTIESLVESDVARRRSSQYPVSQPTSDDLAVVG